MDYIKTAIAVISAIAAVIGVIYTYRAVFGVVGFFTTRKFPKAKKLHKYAFLIAARNEEKVIANLVESIRKQDYPAELIEVFVVAHNCNDNTAAAARAASAVCYECDAPEKRTKGFALQFLVECIRKDYGIESFDGYFIFDADNLLKRDYVMQMNDCFDAGEKIVTSYRNIKNFNDNWIAASYGIHWLRTVRFENRARSVFRLATRVQGTGYLFAAELIKDGWKYTGLTEDRAFCADAVARGYKISFNNKAEFYDEQPVGLKIALRQRLRWAKGNLHVFYQTGGKLFGHIFYASKDSVDRIGGKNGGKARRLLANFHIRFMSFDMLSVVFPYGVFVFAKNILICLLRILLVLCAGYAFVTSGLAPAWLSASLDMLNAGFSAGSAAAAISMLVAFLLLSVFTNSVSAIATAAYIFIMERKHIMYIPWYRKLWFCLMFPFFDIIGKFVGVIALFKKVEWKVIPHSADIDIEEMEKKHSK